VPKRAPASGLSPRLSRVTLSARVAAAVSTGYGPEIHS
jgi:hypothetical protein